MIEIIALAKEGGPLTKRISLTADGSLHSDGSGCVMARGSGGGACGSGASPNPRIASFRWIPMKRSRSGRYGMICQTK